ncbi:MAG: hypothetical protein PHY74_08565 [Candidatus Bathyarchaeota archaeon]|nr:hypothetical protein [Candidatus Bathyarchaeota archaeon]
MKQSKTPWQSQTVATANLSFDLTDSRKDNTSSPLRAPIPGAIE